MRKFKFLLFGIFVSLACFAQNMRVIDSLLTLSKSANDTTKANYYNMVAALWAGSVPEKNKEYGYKIIELGKKSGSIKHEGVGYFKLGIYYYTVGNQDSSKYFYFKAIEFSKKINYSLLAAYSHQNLGLVYENEGDYESAIKENISAITLFEASKKPLNVADLKNNIAVIYINQKDYISAEKYLMESYNLLIKEYIPGSLAYVYQNLGLIQNYKNNALKCAEYYRLALKEFQTSNNLNGVAGVYQNLGLTFMDLNQPDSAIYYCKKTIELSKALNNPATLYGGYLNAANVYLRFVPKPHLVTKYLDSAQAIGEVHVLPEYKVPFLQTIGEYHLAYGDKGKGFLFMDDFSNMKDSLLSLENIELIKNLNTKYETEKKDLQIQNQSLEISAQEKENEAKTKVLIIGTVGLFAVVIFAFVAFRNFKKTQKANIIINSQKEQVELQKEEIEHQKLLVEEKQKEILDSIHYAQKIQAAVLTGDDVWKKISQEYFILFQPKDIVSGDFYWAYNTVNSRAVFALADCTGHGVPGGFMSMLGNSFLNELVVENKFFNPAEILNKLRTKIISSLEQKGVTDRRDGMDMAICTWNKLNNTLEFAGANNKLWIIRNGSLIEYAGDKMPVGNYHGELIPFTLHEIQLESGDQIVLSTDGFADQFGGEGSKKLMSKNLKSFIVNNSNLMLQQQKELLYNFLQEWKGKNEQVDDVSIISVKVV
ncbi:MAG: SpoIIE family protein phosphatase [Bacteroidetes bacterium]|nr:SpoIIE family protein phosphatase [Bacteroidota bacterium]